MPSDVRVQAILKAVVRGELEWSAVREAGVEIEFGPNGCRTTVPAHISEFDPLVHDVASGFLAACRRADLREWADVMLCGPFGFDEFAGTPEGERLKELLWEASIGSTILDDDIAFVAGLAESS